MTKKTSEDLNKIVARNIKAERLRLGMSQEKLASLTGFSVRYISRLETDPQNLRLDKVQTFSEALDVSPMSLMKGADCGRFTPSIADQFSSALHTLQGIFTQCVVN